MTSHPLRSDPLAFPSEGGITPAQAALWATCIGGFLFQFDLTALAAALADVGADFALAGAASAWVIDVFSLGLVLALPACGTLADRWGRRRMFALGAVVFAMASATCASAPSFVVLLAGRALQGVGGAALTSASLALVAATTPVTARPRAFAINGTVIGIAMVIGPPLGALVAATVG